MHTHIRQWKPKDLTDNRVSRLGCISHPVGSVTGECRATGRGEQCEPHDQPGSSASADFAFLRQGVSNAIGSHECKGQHADTRKEVGDELDLDQDGPLSNRHEERRNADEPEEEETHHLARVDAGRLGHPIRDIGDTGEDGVEHHVDALTAGDVVDTVPDASGESSIEHGPKGPVDSKRASRKDWKGDVIHRSGSSVEGHENTDDLGSVRLFLDLIHRGVYSSQGNRRIGIEYHPTSLTQSAKLDLVRTR